ncbi:MAG: two-component sensor histidine kinase [Phormidesmis sp. FL-bin-119]|nr:two-component sensor histidine kinase [Pedobacter sp.]
MASLGELTAGIAHEIQNPLNFVNNFSEVSMELIEEVKSEKLKAESERDSDLENELLDDISQNLQKIAHHGKRADFIVKGMLQHSRTSTGERQATNLNVLADEFLKLSYHGLRAKDKSFNAELVTNFDVNLPKVNVVQQDIGRVLLNLFNNAFYAVQERRKAEGEGFNPTVEVSTLFSEGYVTVKVRDNGNGIPEGIKEKIMQPFFTTKPTGEGTGLGLSLSYDIIKAHGGEIKVETNVGEWTKFVFNIPIEQHSS